MSNIKYARVAELADALDLGSSSGNRVGVQISPFAPVKKTIITPGTWFMRKEAYASYC